MSPSEQNLGTPAICGGPKAVPTSDPDLFTWPLITEEDRLAVLEVLSAGSMSGWDVTLKFEAEWAAYNGVKYALAYPNGTMAILAAMYAAGVRRGDEIIAPSYTYWGSIAQAFSLGAVPVFADIDPDSLCLAPRDIEHRITDRTRAILVVHYNGHPADMDGITRIAAKHELKVIEDVSRGQGSVYKTRMCGSIGHVAGMSMMSTKSFPIGEAGMLCTNDRATYERAIAFSHYERHETDLTLPELKRYAKIPLGGIKGRLNQTCAAMGRVQLRHYPERIAAIRQAMRRSWRLLDDVPGLTPHEVAPGQGSSMGGWFLPMAHYRSEELGGLPLPRFIAAVQAEGSRADPAVDYPLHLHPVFNDADIYGDGTPTCTVFADRDVRQGPGALPVSESVNERCFRIPWFKRDQPDAIERHALAYRKVALQADTLMRASG